MKKNCGVVVLSNSKKYPFNDSLTTVPLQFPLRERDYRIAAEVMSSDGETGDVVISDKARNGFKICFTGSALTAEIKWSVEE